MKFCCVITNRHVTELFQGSHLIYSFHAQLICFWKVVGWAQLLVVALTDFFYEDYLETSLILRLCRMFYVFFVGQLDQFSVLST